MKRIKKKLTASLLALSLVMSCSGTGRTTEAKNLKQATFAYFDVGQGNSELVKVGSSATLIDTGTKGEYDELKGQLRKLNVKTINTLVISHPDADHMESADRIIAQYHVKKIIFPKIKAGTQCYKRMTAAIKKYKVKQIHPTTGQRISLAPSCNAQILSADASSSDRNEAGIVMRITYGSRSFLYMGDATARVESAILSKKYKVASDVYLMSHHGSNTANGALFVKKALSSKYKNAVISVGANNRYGHPVKEVVKRAEKYAKKLFRTDKKGAVIYTTNGKTLETRFIKVKHSKSSSSYQSSKKPGSSKNTTKPKSSIAKTWVYITRTGKKYHKAGCRYLRASKIKIKLSDAKGRGYTACSVCF